MKVRNLTLPKIEEGTYAPNQHLLPAYAQLRTYQVPPAVDRRVTRSLPVIQERVEEAQGAHCSLLGYEQQKTMPPANETNWLEALVDGLIGYGTPQTVQINGCAALGSVGCYLERPTKKHPQVDRKEDCRVYQRVVEILAKE